MTMPPTTEMPKQEPVNVDIDYQVTFLDENGKVKKAQKKCCDEFEQFKKETDKKFQALFEHIVTLQSRIVELESAILSTPVVNPVPLKKQEVDQNNVSYIPAHSPTGPLSPCPSQLTPSTPFRPFLTPKIQYPTTNLMQRLTPQLTTTPVTENPTKKCSHCAATETCQWRNVRSKDSILCNACFVYQRKYKNPRPLEAIQNYRNREEEKIKTNE